MAFTTIDDPSAHFNIITYTGNEATRSITNSANAGDFQPDWVWIKETNNAVSHRIFDSSRGATKRIFTNNTDAESTQSNALTSFDSNGFSLGDGTSVNGNSDTYVAYQWKANGGSTTTNAAGANGADHESVFQANDTAGFSIITFTSDAASGDTVIKHGLSKAPTWMIMKSRSNTGIWWVYHDSLTDDGYMHLESTNANQDGSTNVWRNTAPTSSVFKTGLNSLNNTNGATMVGYCFAPIQGFSKFGDYKGNGNSNGPYIYTGFRPQWLLIKVQSQAGNDWILIDDKNSPINVVHDYLRANTNVALTDQYNIDLDLLSNGFKIRGDSGNINASNQTYSYFAFAKQPWCSSKGVPSNAV